MYFNREQEEFLKKAYNVDVSDSEKFVRVLDGYAKPGDTVYWHSLEGINSGDGAEEFVYRYEHPEHYRNMKDFPHWYSLKKPKIVSSYSIDY